MIPYANFKVMALNSLQIPLPKRPLHLVYQMVPILLGIYVFGVLTFIYIIIART